MVRDTINKNVVEFLDHNDEEIVKYACEILCYNTNNNEKYEFNRKWIKKIVEKLDYHELEPRFSCLKTIGNLVLKSDDVIALLFNFEILDKLMFFINSHHLNIKKEVLLLISNICAGPIENLSILMSHKIFPVCAKCLTDEDLSIKIEALAIIRNLSEHKNLTSSLMQFQVLESLITILEVQSPNILNNVLDTLDLLLINDTIKHRFTEIGGVDILEKLQKHPNIIVYCRVVKMMEQHYGIDEV